MSDPGDSAALARDLALRLFDSRYGDPYSGGTGETPSALLVGEVPRDLPYPLPVPEGARVLGTLVRGFPVVVLAALLAAEAALAFYAERLSAAGWTDALRRRGMGDGGFARVPVATRPSASFYAPDLQYRLTVEVAPAPRGHGITILLALTGNLRRISPRERVRTGHIFDVLPALRPPVGGAQFFEGGGGGPDHVNASAYVEGEFPLAALREHYTDSLLHAGWSLADGAESGPVAWSRWMFRDFDGSRWSALLLIVQCADPPRRFDLILKAHRVEGES
jgi:hypothetical protein